MNNMSDLFIDYTQNPLLEELTRDYRALEAVNGRVLEKIADLKQKRGQRLDRKHPDTRLILERDRAHEVALLRLQLHAADLLEALKRLHASRDKLEAGLADFRTDDGMDGLAKNNLLCAGALCDSAAGTYFSQARRELATDYLAQHCSAIHRLHREPAPSADPREYVLKHSGHGLQLPLRRCRSRRAAAAAVPDALGSEGRGRALGEHGLHHRR